MRSYLRLLILRLAGSWVVPRTMRWAIYRAAGLRVSTRSISPGTLLTGPCISVGRTSFINTGCLLDGSAPITIGKRVAIGPRVNLITSTHAIGSRGERASDLEAYPIVIGDGVWIGAAATVLPGVTIGRGCVIAAGAVVVTDCDDGGTYAGVPARRIK